MDNFGRKFNRIPHTGIRHIMSMEDILCVEKADVPKKKKRRLPTEGKDEKVSESFECKIPNNLHMDLNENLPERIIDFYEFKSKYNQLMEYLKVLNKKCLRIKSKKIENFDIPKGMDIEKIIKLSTSAKLHGLLQRQLRIPTICEMIDDAVNINLESVNSYDNLVVNVNYDTNKWSEPNLYKYFNDNINLKTYKLVSGTEQYKINNLKKIPNHLLIEGPQSYTDRIHIHNKVTESYSDNKNELVDDNEIIITFTFFHQTKGHKFKEFDVLSTQTLANLTDIFKCQSIIAYDNLNIKGSCYMLNGVLYPDLRGGVCDYSVKLLEFYDSSGMKVLKSRVPIPQEDAHLKDIKIPVYSNGYFIHYGDCEHRVIITSIRIYDRSRDCPYSNCYPICVFTPKTHPEVCKICNYKDATKIIFNSMILPDNPSYLCMDCHSYIDKLDINKDLYKNDDLTQAIAIDYNY